MEMPGCCVEPPVQVLEAWFLPPPPQRAPYFLEVKLKEQALLYVPCRVVCCLHGGELDRNQGDELPASLGVQIACPWAGWCPRSRGRLEAPRGVGVLLRNHVVDAACLLTSQSGPSLAEQNENEREKGLLPGWRQGGQVTGHPRLTIAPELSEGEAASSAAPRGRPENSGR